MAASVMKTTEKGTGGFPSWSVNWEMKRRMRAGSMACVRWRFRTRQLLGRLIPWSKAEGLLLGAALGRIRLVRPNNALHERMPHNVAIVEVDKGNSLHAGNNFLGFD